MRTPPTRGGGEGRARARAAPRARPPAPERFARDRADPVAPRRRADRHAESRDRDQDRDRRGDERRAGDHPPAHRGSRLRRRDGGERGRRTSKAVRDRRRYRRGVQGYRKSAADGPARMEHMTRAVLDYHELSKHRPERYAPGPGYLDWATQPDPFRTYAGGERVELPLVAGGLAARFNDLRAGRLPPAAPLDRDAIAALLRAFARAVGVEVHRGASWALRCNPSSGNLHPTEGYVACDAMPGLDAGVHHYVSRDHALERRARLAAGAALRRGRGGRPELDLLARGVEVRRARVPLLRPRLRACDRGGGLRCGGARLAHALSRRAGRRRRRAAPRARPRRGFRRRRARGARLPAWVGHRAAPPTADALARAVAGATGPAPRTSSVGTRRMARDR